jgi:hypothetical protein
MTYRGENSEAQTVQLWNGSRWIELKNLKLEDALSTTIDTLWRDAQSTLGFTGSAGARESLSSRVDISGSDLASVQVAKVKLFVVLDAPNMDPVPLDLGRVFNGLTPLPQASSRNPPRLSADILVQVNRVDGSSRDVQRFVASWYFSFAGDAVDVDCNELTNVGGSTVVAATVDGGSPAGPRLTFAQSATGDGPRYLIELDLTFVNSIP